MEKADKIIIYADDDPDDVEDVRLMLQDIDPSLQLVTFSNGLELMQYISNRAASTEVPSCIMLDYNMPIWDGIRTLQAIKNEKRFADLPVMIFSTSSSRMDKELSLRSGAFCFITKPSHHDEWVEVKKNLAHYFHEYGMID